MERRSCEQWRDQLVVPVLALLLFGSALVQCTDGDGETNGGTEPGKKGLPPGWTGDSGSAQGSSPDGSSWNYEWSWAAGPDGKGSGFGYGGSGYAGSGAGAGAGAGAGGSGRTFGLRDGGYGGHSGGGFGGGRREQKMQDGGGSN